MQISRTLFTAALGIAVPLLLAASPSSAGTLTTPALFGSSSQQNICVVTNVGTTPAVVTVEVVGLLTGTDTETCTVQPNDLNSSCQAFKNEFAFCRVTSTKSKFLRAVMMNRQLTSPFIINTVVEAH